MRVERVSYRIIPVAAAVAALLAACGKQNAAPPPSTPEVGVVTVQPQSVPVVSELPGRTNAFLVAQVRARVD
ncbi:CRISPR-associated protein Cas5, partial [Burkholderia sp. 3C]